MTVRSGEGDPCGGDPYPTPEETFAKEIKESRDSWLRTVTVGTYPKAAE